MKSRLRSSTGLAAGLAALLCGACATVPPPAILIEPGVKTAALRLERDVIADFRQSGEGTVRVMHLGWAPDTGHLRVIPELEVVFVRLMGNAIDVRVVNGDGGLVGDWTGGHRTWLSFIPQLGADLLWGLTSSGFVAFDASGREVKAYAAEGAGYLRDVAGARIDEYVALIASGNGYRGRSLLAVYNRDARLVYQEVFAGRTYRATSHPTEPMLFVGAGETVVRYRVLPSR